MAQIKELGGRRTTVNEVFDYLYGEIVSLRLRPGDKISEADIAAQFGVSRQPVRDAFSRLQNMDLILVRPQRATEVRRFSRRAVTKSRFLRVCVEKEVLQRASARCSKADAKRLRASLEQQGAVVNGDDYGAFSVLDYAFHRILCEIADADFAYDTIAQEKAKVDRLCMLSLSRESRMPDLLLDHEEIAERVIAGDAAGAMEAGLRHLSRLDETIAAIFASNAGYFDEEAP
ncbi:transcriptional regulator, GntR family [Poseidonocella pacifica]|uniref:Transcriptional regulator, GntR family n=1 Tax=Poseidonocella pacifica TaxID=871651 RepID=A0A1I0X441_9RHOB|nr:GntR family transcriptional regulator [Poseidonocella pacifica]SFA95809.1 transcriptional regulator, GntR family [Poseidonocella pacifica]